MVTDTIGDFLTRIRNAQERRSKMVIIPSSKMIENIARILHQEGFIDDFTVIKDEDNPDRKKLQIELRYDGGNGVIRSIKRVSKPGVRVYMGYREIPKIKNNFGIAIISTPKGIMTGSEAKKQRVGGEYICTVW